MRTCQSCGAENPPDRDFCSCGEYLRWEPTGFVQAITPEMAAEAAAQATPPPAPEAAPAPPPPPAAAPPPPPAAPPVVQQAAPPAPPATPGNGGNGHTEPPAPPPPPTTLPAVSAQPAPPQPQPVAKTLVRQAAVPPPAVAKPAAVEEAEPATVVLRLPDGDPAKGEVLHQAVEPGQRERVLALVRNQSGIVDNYDLRVEGMPQDWWSIYPGTVYLVPFGSGGTYEQEVEVHLHPPRGPEAEARVWDLKVVADSKATQAVAASAPLALHVEPYVETATTLRPQRKKGRRKADFDVTIANKANAPVLVALDGEDPDGELSFAFNRPPQEIPPGASVKTQMRVRPPKLVWIGRPRDRRLEVKTVTGEEAAARAAAEPLSADVLANAPVQPEGKRRFWQRRPPQIPGVYGPRVFKPQLYPPDVQLGAGGVQLRMPQFRAPQVKGPQLGQLNAQQLAKGVKLPGRGGASAPAAPLLPTQGVFVQRAFLPWWLIPVVALLIALLLLLYKLSPQKAVVPDVVGAKSAFAAEETLTKADLKLDPSQKTQVDDKAPAGSVLKQTPAKGAEVDKNTPVSVLIAVRSGKVDVPKIVGQTAQDADKTLRAKGLTLGQSSPTNADPKATISSQIPAEGEIVKQGTPVNIFFPDPTADDKKTDAEKKAEKDKGKGSAAAAAAAAAAAKDIVVPAIDDQPVDKYAKAVADLGLVPVVVKQFDDAPPQTIVRTDPEPGSPAKKGQKIQLFVSVGQPEVVFSNGKDILRINGATGAKFDPVAAGPEAETAPTWSADGTRVAYVSDGRVMLKDITKKNATPVPLTKAGDKFDNLAWAPTADTNVIAMNSVKDDFDNDLCFAHVTKDETPVSCLPEPGFAVTRAIHWSKDGRTLLGVGVKLPAGTGIFGIVRWRLKTGKPAFSPEAPDWNTGRFVTDIDRPTKGVLDAALSPDGKRLALVSNQGSSAFRLWFAEPKDFQMSNAKQTPVRACKVSWRGDSKVVIVVQGDAECREDVASVVRVDVASVRNNKELSPAGDDPSFQPFNLGG
ncbi:MAG TPA: PASTA domain-containing protein [Solirubrobacter sp.]|nr:PASTA domain-containing protein [Solirubrobacter sp.]